MKYLLIITIFLIACQHKQMKEESVIATTSYFDLADLVQTDIRNNTKNSCGEEKIINVNNQLEKKTINTLDWQKEMQLLLDCDINKPSWKGKFKVDTLWKQDSSLLSITYHSLSNKIQVKRMYIQFANDNTIANITIDKKISSILFSNRQQIIYQPSKSFTVSSHQKAFFMNDFNSEVEIKYLCKF